MNSVSCDACHRQVGPGRRINGTILPPDCCRFCGKPTTRAALLRTPVAYPRAEAACSIRLASVAKAYGG